MNLTLKAKTGQYISNKESLGIDNSTLKGILNQVCLLLSLELRGVMSKVRQRELVEGRYLYFLVSKELTGKSSTKIAAEVNRDHCTFLYGVRTISNLMENNKTVMDKFDVLKKHFKLKDK